MKKEGTNVCEPCHDSCIDCFDTEYDSCVNCKENSIPYNITKTFGGIKRIGQFCQPSRGYYLTSEYGKSLKHGAAANKPLEISNHMSDEHSGLESQFVK
jgi:hypothetical protein